MNTDLDPEALEQAKTARKSVVLVYPLFNTGTAQGLRFCSSGTGFIIRSTDTEAIVMTNEHVLNPVVDGEQRSFDKNRDQVRVRMCSGDSNSELQEFRATLMFQHKVADLALIKVTRMKKATPVLTFAHSRNLPIGQPVASIGYCNPQRFQDLVGVKIPAISPGAIARPPQWSKIYTVMEEDETDEEEDEEEEEEEGDDEEEEEEGDEGDDEEEEKNDDDEEALDSSPPVCITSTIVKGCSGGPVLHGDGVIGVLEGHSCQIRFAISSETVTRVLKIWLGIPPNDARTTQELIELL